MDEIINQIDEETKLLRATEVAEILSISRAFAYRLMQQGKIRTVVIAKTHRVRPSDLKDFIEKSLVPDTPQVLGK